MTRVTTPKLDLFWVFLLTISMLPSAAHAQIGVFEGQRDIGHVLHPGNAAFDTAKGSYTVSGSGENMWFGADDFHFIWKKASGDMAISADINFVGSKGNNHRKAALLFRQTLNADSVYADVALHGDCLTSLQYRDRTSADTHEVETAASAPQRVRIEKRGSYAYVFVSDKFGKLAFSGSAMRLELTGDFYVGLGVCSHDKDVSETAIFSNVEVEPLAAATDKLILWSTLETVKIASTDRLVAYTAPEHFEAPNWTRDGASLLINSNGTMHSFALGREASPVSISTSPQNHVNNDHGLSRDGSMLAISDQSFDGKSRIYIRPSSGGTPRQITPDGPSYWHGWSPDGKTLAFTAQRDGKFDIYTVPLAGGKETRLTTAKGLDDGPEYSPDGSTIYFNSERSGRMQIWSMAADGSNQTQVIDEPGNDWFPHISPDGKWMVYLAYRPGVTGHPGGQDVELRLMSIADRKIKTLATLYGGQGTINVPSWSPDSTRVAFVSYAELPR
jgi:TolB protein